MKKTRMTLFFTIIFTSFFWTGILNAGQYIHHDLKVELKPGSRFIKVEDVITIPKKLYREHIHFLLHGDLKIVSSPADINLKSEQDQLKAEFFGINNASFKIQKRIPLGHYSFQVPKKPGEDFTFSLVYEGKIHHAVKKMGEEYARGFSETPGIIDEQGVYLSGSTFWVPWFNDNVVTFKMDVSLPPGWHSVSQGARTLYQDEDGFKYTVWNSPEPMDEIYLVGARFEEYILKVGTVDVMAFLRTTDESLANKYLETTGQYLEMYEKLIGPYPYSKFALVENFWETGYGMPSFTLLGSKIIRFPFILHSSYPHELLHNWWGNSVFVDYDSGNWCEGLTVYLADHLIKEQRGQGTAYRKTSLQGYTDYAAGKEEEFPLTRFKARYDALSSAIGYGKSMMLFHMLRLQVGDRLFIEAVRDFYKENKFRRATFADVGKSFEKVTGSDFYEFFDQWVTRTGAPEIRLSRAQVSEKEGKYLLNFTLNQVQDQAAYTLTIPAAIYLQGNKEAVIKRIRLSKKEQEFTLTFASAPLRIDIDPEFDIFRKLHRDETSPTLSKVFGAQKVLILLPSKAAADFLKGYRELAQTWSTDSSGKIEIKMDNDLKELPGDRSVWLFGRENIHKKVVAEGIAAYDAEITVDSFKTAKQKATFTQNSIVVSAKNPANPKEVVVLLSTDTIDALPGLGRKLPHYGKYSYLGFSGDEPANHLKGEWQIKNSPMTALLSEGGAGQSKPKRKSLATLAPLFSEANMMEHIRYLASEELEGRGTGSKGIIKAAAYIANIFRKPGLKPGGANHSYFQTWYADAGKENSRAEMRNVIGIIPGTNPEFNKQSVVVCAHYDHLGLGWPVVHRGDKGKIHFGADDNASGVAVLLELAERLGKSFKPERSIVFIAFTGEESGLLGSKYYVENLAIEKLENIMAVVNLDTVGRFDEEKGKLLIIGSSSAREWRFIFMGIGYTVGIETDLITQELDASDQVSFVKKGIPGIQLFSGPHADYHRPTDTVDKIIPAGLVKVAAVAREAVVYLTGRKEPLTFTGSTAKTTKAVTPAGAGSQRRAGTGLMPDFSYKGKGVKIGALSPGSPAEKAGLKKGDIIIKLGTTRVDDLRQYASALKAYNAGDTTTISYTRGGTEHTSRITLSER
ncbi:MAG: M20/M25/M40 family metallo-hydrolase [Candidatus Aminicenantes bacterium]|nr:M20/M25/M40 family metallo-hydrolase [Candidatus Aminicenantes bacterium]